MFPSIFYSVIELIHITLFLFEKAHKPSRMKYESIIGVQVYKKMTLSLGILLCSTSNQYAGADPEGSVGVGPPSAGPTCPFHVSNIFKKQVSTRPIMKIHYFHYGLQVV